ncbi:hypothetical protein [Qipengyuania nanhaisediminis]|uniref:hypothetical protein n=1 Tax=Qipengyuania nanhaisediminis TaxID=604088 RepID=UPI001160C36B|nr:hypothetical protein [Qipengyuania nanhaisediminis]
MSDNQLVAALTVVVVLVAVSVGAWIGLRLVRGSNLKSDPPRLKKLTIAIWIAAVIALGVWLLSRGAVGFSDAVFGFVLASIVTFAVFRQTEAS